MDHAAAIDALMEIVVANGFTIFLATVNIHFTDDAVVSHAALDSQQAASPALLELDHPCLRLGVILEVVPPLVGG